MPICRKNINFLVNFHFLGRFTEEAIEGAGRLSEFKRRLCARILTSSCWWVSIKLTILESGRNKHFVNAAAQLQQVYLKDEHISCAIFMFVEPFSKEINGSFVSRTSNIFSFPLRAIIAHRITARKRGANERRTTTAAVRVPCHMPWQRERRMKNLYNQQIKRRFRKQISRV